MWASELAAPTKFDGFLRLVVAVFLGVWLWNVGTHLETPYPEQLIELYALPLTRIFLLILVLAAAAWCPTVGVLAALAYVCLGADVIFFTYGGQTIARMMKSSI